MIYNLDDLDLKIYNRLDYIFYKRASKVNSKRKISDYYLLVRVDNIDNITFSVYNISSDLEWFINHPNSKSYLNFKNYIKNLCTEYDINPRISLTVNQDFSKSFIVIICCNGWYISITYKLSETEDIMLTEFLRYYRQFLGNEKGIFKFKPKNLNDLYLILTNLIQKHI